MEQIENIPASDGRKNGWRPSPKFLLRRHALRRITKSWMIGTFLEVGAGTGTMTRLFLERGFIGTCFDVSERTLSILSSNLKEHIDIITVVKDLVELSPGTFNYLFAFEVLEHIDGDAHALEEWTSKLEPGGRILLSVPAHQKKYSKEDEYVGHLRRYEKYQLRDLLAKTGYESIEIYSYGFPLGNVTGFLSRMLNLSGRSRDNLTLEERSVQSGIQRSPAIRALGRFYNEALLTPFFFMQVLFWRLDLGDGYIATGVRRRQAEQNSEYTTTSAGS